MGRGELGGEGLEYGGGLVLCTKPHWHCTQCLYPRSARPASAALRSSSLLVTAAASLLSSRVSHLEKLSVSRAITLLKFRATTCLHNMNNYNNSSNIIMTTGSHRTIHVYRVCS